MSVHLKVDLDSAARAVFYRRHLEDIGGILEVLGVWLSLSERPCKITEIHLSDQKLHCKMPIYHNFDVGFRSILKERRVCSM